MSSENSYFQEHWLSDERFKNWLDERLKDLKIGLMKD